MKVTYYYEGSGSLSNESRETRIARRRRTNESHVGTHMTTAKAVAKALSRSKLVVHYPSKQTLNSLVKASTQEEVAAITKGNFRFVFSQDLNTQGRLYPTVIAVSDSQSRGDNTVSTILASHLDLEEDSLLIVALDAFRNDQGLLVSDIFEFIDGEEDEEGAVSVKDFAILHNDTVRELMEASMVYTLTGDMYGDIYDVCERVDVNSSGMKAYGKQAPNLNLLSRSAPKYDVVDGEAVLVGDDVSVDDLAKIYNAQFLEWTRPRNHAGGMWQSAFEGLALDLLIERNVSDLDFNPYTADEGLSRHLKRRITEARSRMRRRRFS